MFRPACWRLSSLSKVKNEAIGNRGSVGFRRDRSLPDTILAKQCSEPWRNSLGPSGYQILSGIVCLRGIALICLDLVSSGSRRRSCVLDGWRVVIEKTTHPEAFPPDPGSAVSHLRDSCTLPHRLKYDAVDIFLPSKANNLQVFARVHGNCRWG